MLSDFLRDFYYVEVMDRYYSGFRGLSMEPDNDEGSIFLNLDKFKMVAENKGKYKSV